MDGRGILTTPYVTRTKLRPRPSCRYYDRAVDAPSNYGGRWARCSDGNLKRLMPRLAAQSDVRVTDQANCGR